MDDAMASSFRDRAAPIGIGLRRAARGASVDVAATAIAIPRRAVICTVSPAPAATMQSPHSLTSATGPATFGAAPPAIDESTGRGAATPAAAPDKPHVDPVCGMRAATNPDKAFEHHGHTYYFCSQGCRTKFAADPEHFLAHPPPPRTSMPAAAVPVASAARSAAPVEYVCPMDPEVVQDHPGACPLCGMALEPRMPVAGDAGNAELDDMTRRLWIAAALTVPLWIVAMGPMLAPGRSMPAAPSWIPWLQAALATPVVGYAGCPFFERAWVSFRTGRLNMFSLIGLGTGASWLFSIAALAFPDLLPDAFREHGQVPLYFEAAAGITTLVLVGQVLELRARARTGGAIRALLALAPAIARRIDPSGRDVEVAVADVRVGDRLRVRPGDQVPVDGTIEAGDGALDESMVTGESVPVAKGPGDRAVAGSLNQGGSFVLRADRVGADTLLARIATLVADAGRTRAPIQKLADRVAGWFVPLVIGIAVLAAIAWAVWGPAPALAHALVAAVSVLIIACPCALGLATPISVTVAVGRGARDGILVKDAEALERLARIDTLVVDKTGTLTEGRATVSRVDAIGGFADDDVLRLAGGLEQTSAHPLAAAVVRAAAERGLVPPTATDTVATPGAGVRGRVDGRLVVAGNRRMMELAGVDTAPFDARADALRTSGETALFVAIDGRPAAIVAVADPVKPTTERALADLAAEGLDVVMLTGDHETTARALATRLGIKRFHAGVDPEAKQAFVAALTAEGRRVAMAGDGINDAPALAAADVGIAMGDGTDVAMETARVVLIGGDLRGIVAARRLGRAALANIRQNLFFAFVYNAVGVPIAAGVLYPWFGVVLGPTIAAAAMSLSSVSVITNALRLRNVKLRD